MRLHGCVCLHTAECMCARVCSGFWQGKGKFRRLIFAYRANKALEYNTTLNVSNFIIIIMINYAFLLSKMLSSALHMLKTFH